MGEKSTDLTSKQGVAKSREVYAGIVTGKVKSVGKALNEAHGRKA